MCCDALTATYVWSRGSIFYSLFWVFLWHAVLITGPDTKKVEQKDSDDDSDLEIIDVDLSIDVNKMEASQVSSFTKFLILFTLHYYTEAYLNTYTIIVCPSDCLQ